VAILLFSNQPLARPNARYHRKRIGMTTAPRERTYEGVHCTIKLEQISPSIIVLRISGSDVGEFGPLPMRTLDEWLTNSEQIEFFIDAQDGRGVSIHVSAEWAQWLNRNKAKLKSVTMLAGSPLIQLTAEFVRRFATMEGVMWICTDAAVFQTALSNASRSTGPPV
jgi:hypothetical protein